MKDMISQKRFEILAETYGASLELWPESERHDAEILIKTSAEARNSLSQQATLDQLLTRALEAEAAHFLPSIDDNPEAALTRLRAGVAGQIAERPGKRRAWRHVFGRWFPYGLADGLTVGNGGLAMRWTAMACSGGVAVTCGVWLGWMQSGGGTTDALNALLVGPLGGYL